MINRETIAKLISIYQAKNDDYGLELIVEELGTFEEYHSAIYSMETKLKVMPSTAMGREEYQSTVEEMDKTRTMMHNRVLVAVNVLNRMAEQEGLPLVYDGIVSRERPYRREVADAVLEYVQGIIIERRN